MSKKYNSPEITHSFQTTRQEQDMLLELLQKNTERLSEASKRALLGSGARIDLGWIPSFLTPVERTDEDFVKNFCFRCGKPGPRLKCAQCGIASVSVSIVYDGMWRERDVDVKPHSRRHRVHASISPPPRRTHAFLIARIAAENAKDSTGKESTSICARRSARTTLMGTMLTSTLPTILFVDSEGRRRWP